MIELTLEDYQNYFKNQEKNPYVIVTNDDSGNNIFYMYETNEEFQKISGWLQACSKIYFTDYKILELSPEKRFSDPFSSLRLKPAPVKIGSVYYLHKLNTGHKYRAFYYHKDMTKGHSKIEDEIFNSETIQSRIQEKERLIKEEADRKRKIEEEKELEIKLQKAISRAENLITKKKKKGFLSFFKK